MSDAISRRARIAKALLYKRKKLNAGLLGNIAKQRSEMARSTALPRWLAAPVSRRQISRGGIDTEVLTPKRATDKPEAYKSKLLYLHGGGYVMGNAENYRSLTSRLAKGTGFETWVPNYRLAPEHPFPAAIDDAVKVYAELLRISSAEQIVIAGDSAGGGLCMALLLKFKALDLPMPRGCYLISPLLDQSFSGDSFTALKDVDPILDPRWLTEDCFAAYSAGTAADNPYLSPLFGELTGLPPLFIQVGSLEILLDDSLRLAEQARRSAVTVNIETATGLWHDWQLLAPLVPESQQAIDRACRWLKTV